MGDRTQDVHVKCLVGRQICRLHPQHIFKCTSNIMAFRDLRGGLHRVLKSLLCGLRMLGQPHGNIDNIAPPRLFEIQPRAIALNHPRTFQFLHTPQTGRG